MTVNSTCPCAICQQYRHDAQAQQWQPSYTARDMQAQQALANLYNQNQLGQYAQQNAYAANQHMQGMVSQGLQGGFYAAHNGYQPWMGTTNQSPPTPVQALAKAEEQGKTVKHFWYIQKPTSQVLAEIIEWLMQAEIGDYVYTFETANYNDIMVLGFQTLAAAPLLRLTHNLHMEKIES